MRSLIIIGLCLFALSLSSCAVFICDDDNEHRRHTGDDPDTITIITNSR
ncbi:MAG: hypothetical protein ABSF80_12005 [Chitinispirillaceae bacterium]